MNNQTPIEEIKGIGDKTAQYFHALNIYTVNDLVHFYPRTYDQYEIPVNLKDAEQGTKIALTATVKSRPQILRFSGKTIVSFVVGDEYGSIEVKYFNAPYMAKAVNVGDKKVFRGNFVNFRGKLTLDQPKIYSVEDYDKLKGTIIPVYHLTKGLSNDRLIKALNKALPFYECEDYMYEGEVEKYKLVSLSKAIKDIHFPENSESQFYARRRIVFDEFLYFLLNLRNGENKAVKEPNNYKLIEVADCLRLEEALPYKLTGAQKRVISEIFADLSSDYLMNRLVQGDVGSGKTIIAVMALLMNAGNGYQGALMAPTEVLARQHFENIKSLSDKYKLCIRPILLTGKMSAKDKREANEIISEGKANVIIGTHALIQDKVSYKNLSLVITDEQHRFGVKQREALRDKGIKPHILVMSATPIPRTLAMIFYGGTSVSRVDELPKNRLPIANCVVNDKFREKAYEKIYDEIKKGHQAYVICPMIEEEEENILMLKSVKEHAADLKDYFGDRVRIGVLHGKMKPDEKARLMEEFKDKKFDILVSTTVIEVGIDVPNATVIMIENAERFGLSQLHQLRGRVGRGDAQSYCILMSDSKEKNTLKRLKILNESNNGFEIAEKDMELRGPGELNGLRQSGELSFSMGDLVDDLDILTLVSDNLDSFTDRQNKLNINLIDFRSI